MKPLLTRCVILTMAVLLLLQIPTAAMACATCGCSEVCALNLIAGSETNSKKDSWLSNSIWGRLILGLAYNRDPELRKLGAAGKVVGATGMAMLAGAGAAALPQSIVSLYTLPDSPDSYAPLKIGIPLVGISNLAIWGRMIGNAGLRRKIRARQDIVRGEVETILHHLQYSEWSCPQAEKELSALIGPHAAQECVQLWTTSHTVANRQDGGPAKPVAEAQRVPHDTAATAAKSALPL